MQFIEIKITTTPEIGEMLIAELVEIGYDSFQETDTGLDAYVEEEVFSEQALQEIIYKYSQGTVIGYSIGILENKNWNEEWEKNFQPVTIGEDCIVRASFHEPGKKYKYDIVINPKMSFGTGHHETTSMMIAHQLEIDHRDKTVMDAGSGTGILAIMASMLGAKLVDAFDIEDWAFENMKENAILNGCSNIRISQGDITKAELREKTYDIILANINRNVLLEEIPEYAKRLKTAGKLVLSGFYKEDVPMLEERTAAFGLKKTSTKEKNNWASLVFIKA
ncbi:MAG TPA: 50S ribosomal protein L11 methyltransferase [Cytophagaceae bacterium]|jgi:ribosomal protein L11 methyltransferase|nr:50S ribosomal protein L11 methyltransferase [Cytophagaceae bacterium]